MMALSGGLVLPQLIGKFVSVHLPDRLIRRSELADAGHIPQRIDVDLVATVSQRVGAALVGVKALLDRFLTCTRLSEH